MSAPAPPSRVVAVTSARHDGATSVAAAIAARLATDGRTLLLDLDPDLAEVAALLDVDDRTSVYHLAHRAQLAPVDSGELEEHVRWHEGLAVLPGITDPGQAMLLRERFVQGLLSVAAERFEWVVADLGRARADLSAAATRWICLWVVVPGPLGLVAFDRHLQQMRTVGAPWLDRVQVVVNQMAEDSLSGVAEFLGAEHGLAVAGTLPYEPGFWRGVELSHSLQALSAEITDEARHVSWFGRPALRTRRALDDLVAALRSAGREGAAAPKEA